MLNFVHKSWFSYRRINNTKNNSDPPKGLLLNKLPTEVLSQIILELLNDSASMRSFKFTYLRGLLDTIETLPELSTNQMIPLAQVNKFFYELVWTITFNCSYWNQEPKRYEGWIRGSTLYRSKPFVLSEDMLQSRGLEPENQFHLRGYLSRNQLQRVRHVIFQELPFLLSSAGTGLQRCITIPKLQFLTTLKIDTCFLGYLAQKYENLESQFWGDQIKRHGGFEKLGIKLSPFITNYIKQVGYNKFNSYMVIVYYNLLICQAIANMISLLDHTVSCTVVHSGPVCLELNCLIAMFAEHNITSQIDSLITSPCGCISSKECMGLLALLKPKHLVVWDFPYRHVTDELATVLVKQNPNLISAQIEDVDFQNLEFPSNIEMLRTSNYPIFSKFNLPLNQKFTNLVEFGIDFQSQVETQYIKRNLLHLPTLQTLRISGLILKNMELIVCLLESNPTVTSLSIYFKGYYEHLGPLYCSMRNVKLLDLSYRDRLENLHTFDFSLESMLDVILSNTKSLEMLLIHKHNQTENLSFKELATKLSIEYEKNTRHLRYIHVYNGRMTQQRLNIPDLIPMFFNTTTDDAYEMSPYNVDIKKLYRIDSALLENKMNPERCRLELDVRGIRRLFYIDQ